MIHNLVLSIHKKYQELGISIEVMKRKTSLSKNSIYNIFSGRSKPSLEQIDKLANAVGFEISIKNISDNYILVTKDENDEIIIERIEYGSKTLIESFPSDNKMKEQYPDESFSKVLEAMNGQSYLMRRLKPYIYSGAEIRIKI